MAVTFIVETGSREIDANSYVDLTFADNYADTYGYEDWASLDEDVRKRALIQGSMAVDLMYGDRYQSQVYPNATQSFLFPRQYYWDANGFDVLEASIPKVLKQAVVELAIMHTNEIDIFPDKNVDVGLRSYSVSVGEISESKTWGSSGATGSSFPGFRKVDLLMRSLLKSNNTGSWSLHA